MPGPKRPAMTLAQIIVALDDPALGLKKSDREQMQSAIRTFCKVVGRDPSEIIADPSHINHLLKGACWTGHNFTKGHWGNIVSRLRSALRLMGIDVEKRRNFKLAPVWQATLGPPLPRKKYENLSRFAGWCTVHGITPAQVNVGFFGDFLRFNYEQSIQRDPRERWQEARRAWNVLAELRPELALPKIPNTVPAQWRGLRRDQLPATLQSQFQAWEHSLKDKDVFNDEDEDEDDPLEPVSIENYLNNLRRFISHMVDAGVPLTELNSFEDILQIPNIKRTFSHLMVFRGKSPEQLKHEGDTTMHALHAALVAAAKFHGAVDDQWAYLRKLGKTVRPKQMEMTAKNVERVLRIMDPETERKYLRLPLEVAKRLIHEKSPNRLQALDMQAAAALELFIKTALRLEDIADILLDTNLRRSHSNGGVSMLLHWDAHQTKGKKAVDISLTPLTVAVLQQYISVFRPVLLGDRTSSALFVTQKGKAKSKAGLAKQLKKFVRREIGVPWNPHIVRSHAGFMALDEDPHAHNLVQELLQHSSVETTKRHYLPQQRAASRRRYDAMIERRRDAILDTDSRGERLKPVRPRPIP